MELAPVRSPGASRLLIICSGYGASEATGGDLEAMRLEISGSARTNRQILPIVINSIHLTGKLPAITAIDYKHENSPRTSAG